MIIDTIVLQTKVLLLEPCLSLLDLTMLSQLLVKILHIFSLIFAVSKCFCFNIQADRFQTQLDHREGLTREKISQL